MNRLLLILTLCFVISGITFSQARFFEGFIIANNQDTLHGLIEYKGNQTSTEVCIYKENEQSAPVSYKPYEIKGYKYGMNKFYVSKEVYQNGQKRQMFVEYLVDGIIDLYCYYENSNPHYLVQTENDSLIELKVVKKLINASDAKAMQNRTAFSKGASENYVYESKTYVYILKDVFKASPKVAARADQAALSHGSLIKLASSYHHEMCPDQECKIYKKGSDGNLKAGIMLGVGNLSLGKSSSNDYFYYYLGDIDLVTYYPYLGFFVLTGLPGINANMYFQFEGAVNRFNMEVSGYSNLNGMIFYNEVEFSQTCFTVNGMLKYALGEKKLRPVLQFGGFVSYGLGESFKRRTQGVNQTGKLSPFSALDFGIGAGTGLMFETAKKKTILLDLRYRLGFNFTDVANANYYSLSIGYQL